MISVNEDKPERYNACNSCGKLPGSEIIISFKGTSAGHVTKLCHYCRLELAKKLLQLYIKV